MTPSQSHCDVTTPSSATGAADMLWCLVRRWDSDPNATPSASAVPADPPAKSAKSATGAKGGADTSVVGPQRDTGSPSEGAASVNDGDVAVATVATVATSTVARLEWQSLQTVLSWSGSSCLNKDMVGCLVCWSIAMFVCFCYPPPFAMSPLHFFPCCTVQPGISFHCRSVTVEFTSLH